ncbi:DUF6801 domain-containing protein [Streptomyces laurentii]
MTALATTSVMVGAVGAGTASAQQLSRTFGYTCTSFMAGTHSFTAQVTATLPDKVVAGRPGRTIGVNVTAKVDASFTRWLADTGYATVEGTVDASAHVDAPRQQVDLAVPFRMAKTTAPASGPLTIKATGSVTTPTFDHPGRATVTTGGLTLHILARTKTGLWGSTDASCTLDAGRSNVVTSFDITAPGSTDPTGSGGSAAPKPTTRPAGSHTAPKPTTGSVAPAAPDRAAGSVAADAPKPATPKGAGPTAERPAGATTPGKPSAQPSSATEADPAPAGQRSAEPAIAAKPPATGLETRDLVLLAVGVLLACAAAFHLGTRRKNHRHAADADPAPSSPVAAVADGGPDADHHRKPNATARRPRGRDCGNTPRGSMGRSATEGKNVLLGRHAPTRTTDTRARKDTDVPNGADTPTTTHEEPATDYAGQS